LADQKISALTGLTTLATGDTIPVVDATDTTTKKTTFADLFGLLYPIGSIYISTLSTNPGTLLGVGTWSAYAAGRVLVSKAASGTFDTAAATGGAETHTLSALESGLRAHNHTIGDNYNVGAGAFGVGILRGSGTGAVTADATAAAAADAHNNLQPYVVVYMWSRTA